MTTDPPAFRLSLPACLILLVALLLAPPRVFAENILVISDIHFNPFANCTPGPSCPEIDSLLANPNVDTWHFRDGPIATYGQETTQASLTSGLNEVRRLAVQNNIHDVLVCGDMLEHNFPPEFLKYENKPDQLAAFAGNVVLYVLHQIRAATNNARIYFILGNNDSDLGNYKMPTAEFLRTVANGLFDGRQPANIGTFSEIGYSSAPLSDSVQVIGLNGGLLSYTNAVPDLAEKQLSLLRQDLAACQKQNRHAIIMIHEPFGINPIYSFLTKQAVPNLDQSLQGEYLDVLGKYAASVSTIYTGHYHMEYFEAVRDRIPLIGTIAMNSVNKNNPGFKIAAIDDATGALQDFTTYYEDISLPSPHWTGLYNFTATYNQGHRPVIDVIRSIPSDPNDAAVVSYCSFFTGKSTHLPSIDNKGIWPYYRAAITNLEIAPYCAYVHETFPSVPCQAPVGPPKFPKMH